MLLKNEKYVIGIDIGTSSAKGCLFTPEGRIVANFSVKYRVLVPNPGWREQRADWWWDATREILLNLARAAKLTKENLVGIAITHQRLSFVPVNKEMKPIGNAILWNDTRCVNEIEYAKKVIGDKEIFKKTGTAPGYWTIYKILWLKNNRPDIYKTAYKFVLVPDYICYKLTGKLVTTQSAAILTGALDVRNPNRWQSDILDALGIDRRLMVDEILPSCKIIGEITSEAARKTSIPKGVPVITAAGDQPCGTLGAGLTKSDQVGVNGGTSCTSEVIAESLPKLEDPSNYYLEISPTGKYLLETTIPSGGSSLMNWFKENFGAALIEEAMNKGKDVWSYIYSRADLSPPGSLGMLLIPYFNGAGPPYWDFDTGGIIVGVTLDTRDVHFVRAIIEGLAFEVRRHIMLLESGCSGRIKELLMYGGSSRSDTWNKIFSDVTNLIVKVSETPETTALGAAICAAVGGGLYTTVEEAVTNMVRWRQRYEPNPEVSQLYKEIFQHYYLPLYERIRDIIRGSVTFGRQVAKTKSKQPI